MFTVRDRYTFAKLLFCCTSLVVCCSAAFAQNCPPCYYDEVPLSGHGAAPDGSGRRIITLKVDTSSWGSPPPQNIVDGTQHAADLWNNVQTCYYVSVVTSGTPDYLIASSTAPNGGCADDAIYSYPYKIELLNSLQRTNYSSTLIGNLIAHEIGHGIGLDNAANGCLDGASIMEGYTGTGCQPITHAPTSADVAKVNQNCTNRSSCNKSKESTVGIPV